LVSQDQPVIEAQTEHQGPKDHVARQDQSEMREPLDRMGSREPGEVLGLLELREALDQREVQEMRDRQDHKDHKGKPDHRVQPELLVILDHLVLLDKVVLQDLEDQLVFLAHLGLVEPQAIMEHLEDLALMGCRVKLDLQVTPDQQGLQGHQDPRETKAVRVT